MVFDLGFRGIPHHVLAPQAGLGLVPAGLPVISIGISSGNSWGHSSTEDCSLAGHGLWGEVPWSER